MQKPTPRKKMLRGRCREEQGHDANESLVTSTRRDPFLLVSEFCLTRLVEMNLAFPSIDGVVSTDKHADEIDALCLRSPSF
jgi:hypothetical protein